MNRWYAGLVALMIIGCGGNSTSNLDSGRAEELDGGGPGDRRDSFGKDLETLRSSPLFHEFDVDLFSSDPIQRLSKFNISSADTYKISLKTLDLLTEEKRFTLVQADKITQNGLPNVIAPIGYAVKLEVTDNQVVAVIRSTTSPEVSVKPVPVNTGNNDIIVGDIGALSLLFAGMQQDLSFQNLTVTGHGYSVTAFNRSVSYRTPENWCVRITKRCVGEEATMGVLVSNGFHVVDHGVLEVSVQTVYGVRESKYVNIASLKFVSRCYQSGIQGHFMASTSLGSTCHPAIGAGYSLVPSQSSRMGLGVVVSRFDWNASLDFGLEF